MQSFSPVDLGYSTDQCHESKRTVLESANIHSTIAKSAVKLAIFISLNYNLIFSNMDKEHLNKKGCVSCQLYQGPA